MKLIETIKKTEKTLVYNQYINYLAEDAKDYEKITREKMAYEIIEVIQDNPSIVVNYLSEKELRLLNKCKLEAYYPTEEEKAIISDLTQTFLLITSLDFNNDYYIPEELYESIQKALKQVNWDDVRKNDEVNLIKLGIMKVYGMLPIEYFQQICKDHDIVKDIFDNYLSRYIHYIEEKDFLWVVYDGYDRYENLILETIFTREAKFHFFDKDTLKSIGNSNIGLISNEGRRLKKKIEDNIEMKGFSRLLWDIFMKACVINNIDFFFAKLKVYVEYHSKPYEEIKKLAKEAFSVTHSAVLLGCTPKEYEEIAQHMGQKLTEKEADLFYEVYFGLIHFANEQLKVFPNLKIYKQEGINPAKFIEIRRKLFNNLHIIDLFVKKNPFHFNKEKLQIAKGFKKGIYDQFFVIKYEKEYTVFANKKGYYGVIGLRAYLNEVLQNGQLPKYCEALLLPFHDKIVIDGVLGQASIGFSNNVINVIMKDYKINKVIQKL